MRNLVLLGLLAGVLSAQSGPEVRASVTRALPPLERSAATFVSKRSCVSCHHNHLPVMMFHLAREHGVAIDPAVLSAVEDKTFRELREPKALDGAVQAATLNDPTPDDSFLLMAAHSAGLQPDLTTAVYARRLTRWERDGHWVTSDFRPPHSSSLFTDTATAVRAVRLYMPEELRAEGEASILRARHWLFTTRPASTEDASFRVMGLVWAGAPASEIDLAKHDLLALQRPSGGWAELPRYEPDAYSTGEALYALHEAGTPIANGAWRKGLKFLISTQAGDGTWRVHTRMISPANVSPTYFETGFPYGKDEFLSYAGSCWAVMALLTALPASEPQSPVPSKTEADPWVRTALFGTPQQLAALLDAGLDPNTKTKNGTTLLMMAVPDAEKVRLLLARGADAKVRVTSGYDALTIATTYRGTAAVVKALLDAGAETQAPKGVRVKFSPLALASMTGDLENVKVLLAHGADALSAPLASAVTFGYPDVVQTLIAAGARATMTESTGINLLHWAVITNHPVLIPPLIEAGAALNAIDDFGYTPLMYAATIDFGNADAVKALLKAGADPNIRNEDGRTAIEQAHYHKHVDLEAALR